MCCPFKPSLFFHLAGTIKGGTCFIELGMACEAVGLQERAMKIYKKVTAQNSDEAIRRQAKQLTFGFEA
jgi:hypothetical protein